MKLPKKQITKVLSGTAISTLSLGAALLSAAMPASAANLVDVSMLLSDSRPGQQSTYTARFKPGASVAVGCIRVRITTTATGNTTPTGLSTNTHGLGTFVGLGAGWTKTNTGTEGLMEITNGTPEALATSTSYEIPFTLVTNPSTAQTSIANGPYYARITTYSDTACTTEVDKSTVAFRIQNGVEVSATVDPILTVAVSGLGSGAVYKAVDSVPNTTHAGCTQTDMVISYPSAMSTNTNYTCGQAISVTTNGSGFTTTLKGIPNAGGGTGFLRALGTNNAIADITSNNTTPGAWPADASTTENKFGYTTNDPDLGTGSTSRFNVDNTWAGVPWGATAAAEVVYNNAPGTETRNVAYRLRFSGTQKPGSYTGTVVYVTTATF